MERVEGQIRNTKATANGLSIQLRIVGAKPIKCKQNGNRVEGPETL